MIFPPYSRPAATLLDVIADFVMLYAAVMLLVFALSYAGFFNWRKTSAGRSVLYFVSSLCAVFVLIVAGKLFGGDYFLREWLRFGIYLAVAVTSTRLLFNLWRNWKKGIDTILEKRVRTGPVVVIKTEQPASSMERSETSSDE